VEALALRQIWPLLPPLHQRALLALAEYQDHEAAAEMAGIAYHLLVTSIYEARRTFLAHWHDLPAARIQPVVAPAGEASAGSRFGVGAHGIRSAVWGGVVAGEAGGAQSGRVGGDGLA
jgi:hypothetical protein